MPTNLIISLNLKSADGSPVAQDESFTLVNLAGINTNTATAVTGKWNSSSRFLGADFSGSYYVTKELLGPEEGWGLSVLAPFGILVDPFLPIGFFFDTADEAPFMAIEGFEPQKFASGGSTDGVGHLIRCPFENRLSSFNFHWNVRRSGSTGGPADDRGVGRPTFHRLREQIEW